MQPDPNHFYQFILAAGVVLSLTVNVIAIINFSRKQKREVSISPEVVTKSDCELKHLAVAEKQNHVDKTLTEVKTDIATLTKSLSDHTGKLHARVDTLLAGVARIEGRLEERSKQ